uniref:Uncharacterized protein n=1 Tax=Klebsiella pneumoniae TaxID=573 RepID=A0A6G9HP42_KLEPN|nr:hypothetical protein [Klebsiella pneumoniae]
MIFQAFSVSRIYKFCSLVLPRSLGASPCRSTAASTAGSIISVAGRHIRIVFINPGSRRDRTLRPVKGGLRPLNHTPEINNAEFYDNVIAGNFPDRFSRFSGGNNPVPCHADLLAKAINPCGLAFGQLRCIRGKMRHIQTFH